MRALAGILSLLLAAESLACTSGRKNVTVSLHAEGSGARVISLLQEQQRIIDGVKSYFSGKGIDIAFAQDGEYRVHFVPRSDIVSVLHQAITGERQKLGLAWPDAKYAEVYLYKSRRRQASNYEFGFARDIARTVEHELGHLFGLGHSSDSDNAMYPEMWIPKRMDVNCEQVRYMHASIGMKQEKDVFLSAYTKRIFKSLPGMPSQ